MTDGFGGEIHQLGLVSGPTSAQGTQQILSVDIMF